MNRPFQVFRLSTIRRAGQLSLALMLICAAAAPVAQSQSASNQPTLESLGLDGVRDPHEATTRLITLRNQRKITHDDVRRLSVEHNRLVRDPIMSTLGVVDEGDSADPFAIRRGGSNPNNSRGAASDEDLQAVSREHLAALQQKLSALDLPTSDEVGHRYRVSGINTVVWKPTEDAVARAVAAMRNLPPPAPNEDSFVIRYEGEDVRIAGHQIDKQTVEITLKDGTRAVIPKSFQADHTPHGRQTYEWPAQARYSDAWFAQRIKQIEDSEFASWSRPDVELSKVKPLDAVFECLIKGIGPLFKPVPADRAEAELAMMDGAKDVMRTLKFAGLCDRYPETCKALQQIAKWERTPDDYLGGNDFSAFQRHLQSLAGQGFQSALDSFRTEMSGLTKAVNAQNSSDRASLLAKVEDMHERLQQMLLRYGRLKREVAGDLDRLEDLERVFGRDFGGDKELIDLMARLNVLEEGLRAADRSNTAGNRALPPPGGTTPPTIGTPGAAGSGTRPAAGRDVPARRTVTHDARPPLPPPTIGTCDPAAIPDAIKPLVLVVHGVGPSADGWSSSFEKTWNVGQLTEMSFRYDGRTAVDEYLDFARVAGDWALQVRNQIAAVVNANPNRPIIVISHSWGSVAAYLALEGGVAGGTSPELVKEDYFVRPVDLRGARIAEWITLGSPTGRANATTVAGNLRQLNVEVYTKKPALVDGWTNFFDPEDQISNQSQRLPEASNVEVRNSRDYFEGGRNALFAAHRGIWRHPVVVQHIRETYWSVDPSYGLSVASDEAVDACFAETVKRLKAEADQYHARRRAALEKIDDQLVDIDAGRLQADGMLTEDGRAFQLALRMKERCAEAAGLMARLQAISVRMSADELALEARLGRTQSLTQSCVDRGSLTAAAASHAEAVRLAARITEDYTSAAALAQQILAVRAEIEALRKELDAMERAAAGVEARLVDSSELSAAIDSPASLLAQIQQAERALSRSLAKFRASHDVVGDVDPDAANRAQRLQMHINTLTSLGESLRQSEDQERERTNRINESLTAAEGSKASLVARLARFRTVRAANECSASELDPAATLDDADTSRTLSELAMLKLVQGYEEFAAACKEKLDGAPADVQRRNSLLSDLEAISQREQALTQELENGRTRLTTLLQGLQQRMGPACAVVSRLRTLSPTEVATAERNEERVESLLKNAEATVSACRDAEALKLAEQNAQEAQRLTSEIERLARSVSTDLEAIKAARQTIQAEQPTLAQAVNLWAQLRRRFDEADQLISRFGTLRAQSRQLAEMTVGADATRLGEFDRMDASLAATIRQLRGDQSGIDTALAQFAECQQRATADSVSLLERLDTAKVLAELAVTKLGQGYAQAANACKAKLARPAGPVAGAPPSERLLQDVVTTSRQITITVWDAGCEDGDRITVRVNGTPVFENHTLFNRKESRTLTLPSDQNTIEVFANNGGTDCPPGQTPLDKTINSGAIAVSGAVSGGDQDWQLRQQNGTKARLIVDPTRAAATAPNPGTGKPSAPNSITAGASASSHTLRVATVTGAAYTQSANGDRQPLGLKDPVTAGATLQTEGGAQLGLQAGNGNAVVLGQNTQIQLPTPPSKKIKLIRGTIDVTHGSAASREEGVPNFDGVETTDVGLTHRGTRYRVQAGASGTIVDVSEGAVHLTGRYIIKRYKVGPSENAPKPSPAQEMDLIAGESAFAMQASLLTDSGPSVATPSGSVPAVGSASGPPTTAGGSPLPPFVPTPPRTADLSPGASAPASAAPGVARPPQLPSWVGTGNARSAPAATGTASPLAQPDPWNNAQIQHLIDEWLRTATASAMPDGTVVRYNEWAQPLSQAARSTGAPDHPADWTRHRYLWETRMRWTSIDLCTMGEFIDRRVAGRPTDGCAKGVPTWIAPVSPQQSAGRLAGGNNAIETARQQIEVIRKQEEEVRRREEERRIAEQRRLDEERRLAEIRRQEQQKLDEQRRLAEERRLAEQRRIEEQQRITRQQEEDERRRKERAQKVQGFFDSFMEGFTKAVTSASQSGAGSPPVPAPSGDPSVPDRPLQDIIVTSRVVTISVWDDACEDGDRITVRVNGQALFDNRELFKRKESLSVTLPFDTNTIEVVANNGGHDCAQVPTDPNKTINTGAIGISNATTGATQTWLLRQRASTVARIVVRP